MALKWGIAGVGRASHDFCVALECSLTNFDHKLIAIASRDKERRDEFLKVHRFVRSYSCYEDLAMDDEVEIVFIAVSNPFHYDVCIMLINSGKHVLCAKPLGMNRIQVKKILEVAQQRNVFIMEGLSCRFFPAYRYMSRFLEFGGLGIVREVYVKHGFKGHHDIESITKKEKGGGVVLDIGVFAIQFVLFVYREPPISIKATGKINKYGVDLYFEAKLKFSGGRKAHIICSGMDVFDNQATIIGTKGVICIPTYWCPTQIVTPDCTLHEWPLIESQTKLYYKNSLGMRYQADEIKKCIRSGKLDSVILTQKEMILIAQIQDEIRKQIGVRYLCDQF